MWAVDLLCIWSSMRRYSCCCIYVFSFIIMLKIVKSVLEQLLKDIETGNCNASEEELLELYQLAMKFKQNSTYLTKEEACRYLNISRATFDRRIADGVIPPGIKRSGLKEKFWTKAMLNMMND